jgi:NADH-quinone oxidoreductase subunit G
MRADLVLIIGTHLSDENPVTDYMVRRMARENRTPVMIVSPRAMKLDRTAHLTLRHRPGTENEVLAALILGLLNRNADRLSGHPAVGAAGSTDAQPLLQAADIAVQQTDRLAAALNEANSVGILAGTEFLRFPRGQLALKNFGEVLKTLDKKLLIVPILDRCNQRGAWEMGAHPGYAPGYRRVSRMGMGQDRMLAAAAAGELKTLFIVRQDPVVVCADSAFVRKALSNLKFFLVQDIFLTETAKMADCVLPGACFAEKEGTFTNQEGRVQTLTRLMRPPGKAMRDFKIFARIGQLFDPNFARDVGQASAVFAEIRQSVGMYAEVDLTFNNRRNEDNDLDNRAALVKAAPDTDAAKF